MRSAAGRTPELPIESGVAGLALIADTLVRRWQHHLPLHRLEGVYGREGLPPPRSTSCGWHVAAAGLLRATIDDLIFSGVRDLGGGPKRIEAIDWSR